MLPSWEGLLKDDFKFKITVSNWRLLKRKQIEFNKHKILRFSRNSCPCRIGNNSLNSRKHPGCNSKSYLNMNRQYSAVAISKSHRGIYIREYPYGIVNNPFIIRLWEGLSWSTLPIFNPSRQKQTSWKIKRKAIIPQVWEV